jgi:quinol monooxygenase YgiN
VTTDSTVTSASAVTATLEIHVRPESLQESYAAVHATLEATRAFPGSLGVDVLIDDADPAHLLLVEHWESLDADAAYREWRASSPPTALRDALAGAPTLTVYRPSQL